VTLIERGAGDGIGAGAAARLTGIGLRAGVVVIAGGAVICIGIAALSRCRIARARDVALVEGGAENGIGPGAGARLTRIGLRAGVVVIAGGAVICIGIAALSRCRIARARDVALVEGGAENGIGAGTAARLTGIGLGAGVAIGASAAIRFVRVGANTRRGIAGAGVVALIERHAHDGVGPGACPQLTGIGLGAGIAVIASAAIRLVRIRTNARRRIADADVMALVERRARNGIGARTRARLTRIGLRARIAVVANDAIGLVWIRANARHRIACARIVALIERHAHDGVGPGACPRLTRIGLGTGVAVVAGRTIGFVRVAA
jgi:hypothetical protein